MALVVLVTHPTDGAPAFARELVRRRIAACVNVVGATSVYRWEGAIHEDAETLLVVKTTAERIPDLEAILRDEHPYDVPELVALGAEHVESRYLAWLVGETEDGPE